MASDDPRVLELENGTVLRAHYGWLEIEREGSYCLFLRQEALVRCTTMGTALELEAAHAAQQHVSCGTTEETYRAYEWLRGIVFGNGSEGPYR